MASTYQPIQEEGVNNQELLAQDQRKLVSLLGEYSDKLNIKCDDLSKMKFARFIYDFDFFGIFSNWPERSISPFFLALGVVISAGFYVGLAFFLEANIFFTAISGMLVVLLLFMLSFLLKANDKKIELMNRNANALVYRLEKLVVIASGFYEYIETNNVNKIELDLKLNDAESALRYYAMVVKKKPGSRIAKALESHNI